MLLKRKRVYYNKTGVKKEKNYLFPDFPIFDHVFVYE